MTNAEISRRLALAIGWDVLSGEPDGCWVVDHVDQRDKWFDYRDPAVIWPIAERFNKWPRKEGNEWKCDPTLTETISADTAAKAVALAVIKLHREEMKHALNKCVLKPVITGTEEAK